MVHVIISPFMYFGKCDPIFARVIHQPAVTQMHTRSTQDFSVEVPNLHPLTGGEHAVVLVGDVRSSTDVPPRPEPRTAGQRHQRGGHAAEPRRHARHARAADQPRVGVDAQQQQVIAVFLPDGGRDGGGAAAVVQKILQRPSVPDEAPHAPGLRAVPLVAQGGVLDGDAVPGSR